MSVAVMSVSGTVTVTIEGNGSNGVLAASENGIGIENGIGRPLELGIGMGLETESALGTWKGKRTMKA
jgi:hypothetical protein